MFRIAEKRAMQAQGLVRISKEMKVSAKTLGPDVLHAILSR